MIIQSNSIPSLRSGEVESSATMHTHIHDASYVVFSRQRACMMMITYGEIVGVKQKVAKKATGGTKKGKSCRE